MRWKGVCACTGVCTYVCAGVCTFVALCSSVYVCLSWSVYVCGFVLKCVRMFELECVFVNVKCVRASAGRRKQYHWMINALLPLVHLCLVLQTPRTQWVLKWPGQIVIAGCQVNWTSEVTEAIGAGNLPALSNHLVEQVCEYVCSCDVVALCVVCVCVHACVCSLHV